MRKLLKQDAAFLDDIQVEMSTARQFLFCIRFRDKKGGTDVSADQPHSQSDFRTWI